MNTKFKAIPQNKDFKIHFKLAQEPLADWLLSLSHHYGSKDACEQILYLLQLLNKTELYAKERMVFLKSVNDYLEQYIALLKSTCADPSFPLSIQDKESMEIITWNYLTLGESFFILAETVSTRDDEVFALYMALLAMGKAQLCMAAIYTEPNEGFWSLVYKVFARAEKSRLVELEINETNLKGITVNTIFTQILIFHLCDTRQFRPREMQTIFGFLAKVCGNLSVYKLNDIKFQTDILKLNYFQAVNRITYKFERLLEQLAPQLIERKESLFILALNQDKPPSNSKGDLTNMSAETRYFCPQLVADNIYKIIETGNLWSGILKSMNSQLFTRVAKALEPGHKRKYDRSKENTSLLGMIGFESVISFLYTTNKKEIPRTVQNAKDTKSSFSNYEELKKYTDSLKTNSLGVVDEYSDFELSYRFRAPESKPGNIWHSGHVVKPPAKKVSLKRMIRLDSSTKGYSFSWDEYGDSIAKIGDIFGIISADKKRLEIALIRRIAMNAGSEFIFGCEILGLKSEIVYITTTDNEHHDVGGENGEWAIFVPCADKLEQFDSVIYNSSHFKVGDTVFLHRNDKVTPCILAKELHSQATISHIELTY
jgi:hypothetical protein